MNEQHKKILRTNRRYMTENIHDVSEILDTLYGKEVLTENMKQEIEAEKTAISRIRKLLDILPKRGPYAFEIFCNVLIQAGYRSVAEHLNPLLVNSGATPLAPSSGTNPVPPTTSSNKPGVQVSPIPQPVSLPKPGAQTKSGMQPVDESALGNNAGSSPGTASQASGGSSLQPQQEVTKPSSTYHPPPEGMKPNPPAEVRFEPPAGWPGSMRQDEIAPFRTKVQKCVESQWTSQLQQNSYKMSSKPRGRALIIKNTNYPEEGEYANRSLQQADMDGARVQSVLTDLGFKFRTISNVTQEDLFSELKKEVACDHNDAFVLFVFSYGGEGTILCADGKEVPVKNIVTVFSSRNCPALAGKPKLFFMQACGTKMKDDVGEGGGDMRDAQMGDPASLELVMRGLDKLSLADPAVDLTDTTPGGSMGEPELSDMLVAMATVPDNDVNADRYSSLFILGLVYVIYKCSHSDTILQMLSKVNILSRDPNTNAVVQLCRFKHSLSKDLYFMPGYYGSAESSVSFNASREKPLPNPSLVNAGQAAK